MQNMKFLGLRTVGYKVPDMQAAKDWYTQVLGKKPYFDEPFYIGFNVGGYELGLQPYEAPSDSPPPLSHTNILCYWGVESVTDTFLFLLEKGASPHEAAQDVGGGIMVASVFDPWGNVFGIIQNPHFQLTD
jgi:lactoylglutathione lyase